MRQPKFITSANDNVPRVSRIARFPQNGLTQNRVVNLPKLSSTEMLNAYERKVYLAWLAPILTIGMILYTVIVGTPISALVWQALALSTVLFWVAHRADLHSRLRNVSTLLLVITSVTSITGLFAYNDLPLIYSELTILVSLISLVVGGLYLSRPSVMLSVFALFGYIATLSPELGILEGFSDNASQIGKVLIPFLLLGQVALARKLESNIITAGVLLTAYAWVITITKGMPMAALAGLGFAIAAAQYCLGKLWAAKGKFGAKLHIHFAALLAFASAFFIQLLWLNMEAETSQDFWSANTFWWGCITFAMFTIFISSLMRYKTSQISLPGIFIICLTIFILPLATAKPDLIHKFFDMIPGLDARPGLGIVIGSTIIACAITWIVNGLRQGSLTYIFIGVLAIGVEAVILYRPDTFNMDVSIVFVISLVCALCVGGLIAGTTGDQPEYSRHYA